MGIYSFTRNLDGVRYLLQHPHEYKDVAHLHNIGEMAGENDGNLGRARVVGIKNLTEHAGATSLTWMMKKCLQTNYAVTAIEVNKRDFMYLNDPELLSSTTENLPKDLMKNSTSSVILVDLNDYNDLSICKDVIYLIEPGTLN